MRQKKQVMPSGDNVHRKDSPSRVGTYVHPGLGAGQNVNCDSHFPTYLTSLALLLLSFKQDFNSEIILDIQKS